MATTPSIAATMKNTGWGDRRQSLFIEKMVQSSQFLNRLTIVDGVKSKALIPEYDAALTYGTNICDLTEGTGGTWSLSEKEVSVKDHTWYFSNCKKTLESTYRSVYLKKGQNNEQTFDDDLLDWLLNHFAKLNSAKAVQLCAEELRAQFTSDEKVTKATTTAGTVIGTLEEMYLAIPDMMLQGMYGETDRDIKPVIFLSPIDMRKYKLEIAARYNTVYDGTAEGKTMPFMGLEVACFNQLQTGEIIIAQPNNLLLVTDDFGDVNSINYEWDKLKNSDQFFGQFKLGFSYRYGDNIVYRATKEIAPAGVMEMSERRK